MTEFASLTKRHIKIFLRDKVSVFFSFLSVIILLFVYLIFLGKMFGNMEGLSEAQNSLFSLGYIIGGVLVVSSLTLPLGVIGTFVTDLETRRINGFLVTPIKRYKLILSYYAATALITIFFVLIELVMACLYIGLSTGIWQSFINYLAMGGVAIVYVLISSPIVVFLVSFIKSSNSFGALSSIIGTLIGFISGIYIPLYVLDSFTRSLASLLPFSHMTIFLRRLLIGENLLSTMPTEALEQAGVQYLQIFGLEVNIFIVLSVFLVVSVSLLAGAYHNMNKKAK